MKISFSVDRRPMACGAALTGAAPPAAVDGTCGFETRAFEAVRTFSVISSASCFRPSATPILGLATKSIAPSSSAFSVTSAPRSVSVDTITTGIGRRRISLDRKSMPSMRGISTSSVMTSGFRLRIISRAANGSLAEPTHSMSVWRLMISVSRLRTSAESSTTTTRVFAMDSFSLDSCRQNRSTEPPPVVAGAAFCAAIRSCCTRASAFVGARRLTIALPLAGRKHTLRG